MLDLKEDRGKCTHSSDLCRVLLAYFSATDSMMCSRSISFQQYVEFCLLISQHLTQ
jgi:hypothetical protein